MGKIYDLTGDCPRCGAPIYAEGNPPTAYHTCDCRLTFSKPLPDVSGLDPESTEDGDRKWLARNRKESEPPSAERAE